MKPENITNETQAREAIETWRQQPVKAQLRNIKVARAALELSAMYYAQKDNTNGMERMEICITMFLAREKALLNDEKD